VPYTIKLEHVPGGYATHCADAGEQIDVVFREFTSTEDGQRFISRLEGIPTKILETVTASADVAASQTNSLLAIIQPNGQTKVFWNEFQPTIQIRSKKKVKAGELVYIDHIMDIERIKLPDEALAPDVAICYLFSFGWRKGLFFDFGPAQPGENRVARDYDIEALLAHYFGRVLFQHLFSIEDETWSELFRQRWFPFSYLSVDTVQNMIKRARERRAIDVDLDKLAREVHSAMSDRLSEWENDDIIGPHLPFVRKAFEHFSAGDFLSSSSILYPRIEGLIRISAASPSISGRLTQRVLSRQGAGTGGEPLREQSLLLPKRFEEYLTDVYFANFRPGSVSRIVSRHSVSHGVVSAESLDRKGTTIGFLILLQLFSVAKARGVQLKERGSRNRELGGFLGRVFGFRTRKEPGSRR
jgi:hypothetical protein